MSVDIAALVEGLRHGERRALARLLTLVEDGGEPRLREIASRLYADTGSSRVIGVTGPPGVGKSTLTSAIAAQLRAAGRTVAILAVDPSSPFSGGALLGDRVRMQSHHADAGVFIRSMAARGHLGGLASATPQAVLVLDAAGFDDIIIETVGVGQSEVEVTATADTTVVALAPGMGDGVQAAKAGVLEIADVFVVNKADASGAGKLESELRGMLEIGHAGEGEHGDADAWWPPIVRTVAVRGEGLDVLVDALDAHAAHLESSGKGEVRVKDRALHLIRELVLEQVRRRFTRLDERRDPFLESLAERTAVRQIDPWVAADMLLTELDGGA